MDVPAIASGLLPFYVFYSNALEEQGWCSIGFGQNGRRIATSYRVIKAALGQRTLNWGESKKNANLGGRSGSSRNNSDTAVHLLSM